MEVDSPFELAKFNSTSVWQHDLASLFHHAKDWFPDIVWELTADDDENTILEEIWGHKAILYARAPPSFQFRYLQFSTSSDGRYSMASAVSLFLGPDPDVSRSPSPLRAGSQSSLVVPYDQGGRLVRGTVLRLSTSINPALFSNELEYLYTGKGMGEAFEFLFDYAESKDEDESAELRIEKLRKDLAYMWRSRLYSDVRLRLTFSSSHDKDTLAVFSCHRCVLISRSSYFYNALVTQPIPPQHSGEPIILSLPSPPFTPASLHFTLGFIYTGTLAFSYRRYDLNTAFQIMRSAAYLSIDTLYDEIQARIIQEMMHGLFHAFLEFSEYNDRILGKWGIGGCRCRQCARRVPRILEFALADDVKSLFLERGARRALVGLFGEGWCTAEFAALPQRHQKATLKGVGKRTIPQNVFSLLSAAEHALTELDTVADTWADTVRNMILSGRKVVDECLTSKPDECFTQPDWLVIMEIDGLELENRELVQWIMAAVIRGINDNNAAPLYQVLVSEILLHPHPTEAGQALLSETSHIRAQVEGVRMEVLRYIKSYWINIRQEGGFDQLEGWALKEIANELDIPVEDLPAPAIRNTMQISPSPRLGQEIETGSMYTSAGSVLTRTSALTQRYPSASPSWASTSQISLPVPDYALNTDEALNAIRLRLTDINQVFDRVRYGLSELTRVLDEFHSSRDGTVEQHINELAVASQSMVELTVSLSQLARPTPVYSASARGSTASFFTASQTSISGSFLTAVLCSSASSDDLTFYSVAQDFTTEPSEARHTPSIINLVDAFLESSSEIGARGIHISINFHLHGDTFSGPIYGGIVGGRFSQNTVNNLTGAEVIELGRLLSSLFPGTSVGPSSDAA